MSAPAIFVSHSHKDDEYCHAFVATLRAAGLDVWYDEHNATAGHLRELIERELRQRTVFVVVLSPAALTSQWVSDECDWAYSLYRRDPTHRVMLPVLAETVNEDDIWLYMQQFKRIEQAGLIPWPVAEAARRVALAINPNAPIVATGSQHPMASVTAQSSSSQAGALLAAEIRSWACTSTPQPKTCIVAPPKRIQTHWRHGTRSAFCSNTGANMRGDWAPSSGRCRLPAATPSRGPARLRRWQDSTARRKR